MIESSLVPLIHAQCRGNADKIIQAVSHAIERVGKYQDSVDSDENSLLIHKFAELLEILHVAHAACDKNVSHDVIESMYDEIKKNLCDISSYHTTSWDDAIANGLPALAREDFCNFATPTVHLEGTSYPSSVVGAFCQGIYVGMDFERAPGIVLKNVFMAKINEVQDFLRDQSSLSSSLHEQQSLLKDCEQTMPNGRTVAEEALEGTEKAESAMTKNAALIQGNMSKETQIRNLYETYAFTCERLWSDAKNWRNWDKEKFSLYVNGSSDSYEAFDAFRTSSRGRSQGYDIKNMLQAAYLKIGKLMDKARKTFSAEAAKLYDAFILQNAAFVSPLHHIQTRRTYGDDVYMHVGFRFSLSNQAKSKTKVPPTPESKDDNMVIDDFDVLIDALSDTHSQETEPHPKGGEIFTHTNVSVLSETLDEFGLAYPLNVIPEAHKMYFCLGRVPTMVMSERCVLPTMKKFGLKLESIGEDAHELGGQFIVNGSEKLLRILTTQRTNLPICLERDHFTKHGKNFSNKAVTIVSQLSSGRVKRAYFHYLTNGEVFMAIFQRRMYFVPVVLLLLSLKDVSLYALRSILGAGVQSENTMLRIDALIKHHGTKPYAGVLGHRAHLLILGRLFRETQCELPSAAAFQLLPWCSPSGENTTTQRTDDWYGLYVLRNYLFPHLNGDYPFDDFENFGQEIRKEHERKFDTLVQVIHRLYHFVDGRVTSDSVDKQSHQGVYTPGRLCVGALSDVVRHTLANISRFAVLNYSAKLDKELIEQKLLKEGLSADLKKYFDIVRDDKAFREEYPVEQMKGFLRVFATGTYQADKTFGAPAPQGLGLSLSYERVNAFRQIELLRTIHRGKSVAESRSSEIRRCQQESWGFMCVVNTPDGHLCGVAQQLSLSVKITSDIESNCCYKRCKKKFAKQNVELDDAFKWVGMRPVVQSLLKSMHEYIASGSASAYEQAAQMPTVCIDGCVIARITPNSSVRRLAKHIRTEKASPDCPFAFCEVVEQAEPFPGSLLLFTTAGALVRPVQVVGSPQCMMVGPWEQTYLNIASVHADIAEADRSGLSKKKRVFTYIEPNPAQTLSYTANTIPYFEHNCSPRNLFVCGILKQSMGNHMPNAALRHDSKLYLMPTTHRHLVGTDLTSTHDMSMNSVNINAVVAIMSYSGLDMEDAIVMNKSSAEHGMFDGNILAGRTVEAEAKMRLSALEADKRAGGTRTSIVFHNIRTGRSVLGEPTTLVCEGVSPNGLPLQRPTAQRTFREPTHFPNTPMYVIAKKIARPDGTVRYVDHKMLTWGEFTESYDDAEAGWIHSVVPTAFDGPDPTEIFVMVRKNRNAVVGDKFSSRHGQKGTLSCLMEQANLPYCMNSGVVPDIIINPHAFPSRMTVGMMLELAAGKAVAHSGKVWNASPWGGDVRWDPAVAQHLEESTCGAERSKKIKNIELEPRGVSSSPAVSAIRQELTKLGLQPFAGEELVNGQTGEPIEGDVFIGICGYQKLRHLVKDKWQARARTDHVRTRIVKKTGQPQGGKSRRGGNRIGEMERDALLSHGATEVLIDRLMTCSDQTRGYICKDCGGMFSIAEKCATAAGTFKFCYYCAQEKKDVSLENSSNIVLIDMPHVLKNLVSEMQGVGIRIAMKF